MRRYLTPEEKKKEKKMKKQMKWIVKYLSHNPDAQAEFEHELLHLNLKKGPGNYWKIWKKLYKQLKEDGSVSKRRIRSIIDRNIVYAYDDDSDSGNEYDERGSVGMGLPTRGDLPTRKDLLSPRQ